MSKTNKSLTEAIQTKDLEAVINVVQEAVEISKIDGIEITPKSPKVETAYGAMSVSILDEESKWEFIRAEYVNVLNAVENVDIDSMTLKLGEELAQKILIQETANIIASNAILRNISGINKPIGGLL